ncbi:MAG: hypothetical protein ABSB15_11495 [Bryobacteraceae bacterium]|jgi:hypothetical protein
MDTESLAEFLQAAAASIVAARLLVLGLAKRQPALLTFLLSTALIFFSLASLPPASAVYFWIYIVSLAVSWAVSLYVVREMFALALDGYPGIRTAGRWAMYGATGISVAASLAVTTAFWNGGARGRSRLLFYLEVVDRSVVFTLAAIVVAILLFLSRYPLHLHRNTYVSTAFFSAVFLSEAVEMMVDSLSPRLFSGWVDRTQILFAAACFVGWAAMLRPEASDAPARVSFENPADRELLQQLESFNTLLARVGRK